MDDAFERVFRRVEDGWDGTELVLTNALRGGSRFLFALRTRQRSSPGHPRKGTTARDSSGYLLRGGYAGKASAVPLTGSGQAPTAATGEEQQ